MMKFLERGLAWLLRRPRCVGFGVQSPFAYHFITEVVRDGRPCAAYCQLAGQFPEADTVRRLHQFLLRLSARLRAGVWMADADDQALAAYVRAGWPEARVVASHPRPDVLLLAPGGGRLTAREIPDGLAALVVVGIHADRDMREAWRRVLADSRTGVTFDVYDCGVAFFDRKLARRNYKVMLPARN